MGNDLTRREFLNAGVTTSAMLAGARVGQPAAVLRPNVLFILADDLGYGDLSCYGRPDYRTPVVDTLAGEGMKFMSAYAAAPVCTPTRCALATGRYPQRLDVGLHEPLTGRDLDKGLPPDHPTVASLVKANGYDTALIGKWHLGLKPEFGPNRHNWPFSFQKMHLWEGGTRVPAIARWPGVIPAARTTEQPAITMDWTATMLAVTGTAPDPAYPLDGEDLMPVCQGKPGRADRLLFWRTQTRDAARMGGWKYLKESGNEHLFDLAIDPGEKNDLRTADAEVFDRIRTHYLAWNAQMLPRLDR